MPGPHRTSATREVACSACALASGRRQFLQELGAVAAGALMALGAAPAQAASLRVRLRAGWVTAAGEVTYPIPSTDGATIDKENQVILVRYQGLVYAFALSCPHQNTALKWFAADVHFQCPKHKSLYQPDGTFVSGRATRNMDRLPIRRDASSVFVDVDHVFQSDKDAAGWAGAVVKL